MGITLERKGTAIVKKDFVTTSCTVFSRIALFSRKPQKKFTDKKTLAFSELTQKIDNRQWVWMSTDLIPHPRRLYRTTAIKHAIKTKAMKRPWREYKAAARGTRNELLRLLSNMQRFIATDPLTRAHE